MARCIAWRSASLALGALLLGPVGAALAQAPGGIGGPPRDHAAAAPAPADSLRISGAVQRPRALDVQALEALPAITLKTDAGAWSGVDLWTLLASEGGLQLPATPRSAALAHYVLVTGSDGYRALFALAELDPAFGARPVLLAYRLDGAPLGRSGMARIVAPGDGKRGRSVANVVSIQVLAAP